MYKTCILMLEKDFTVHHRICFSNFNIAEIDGEVLEKASGVDMLTLKYERTKFTY